VIRTISILVVKVTTFEEPNSASKADEAAVDFEIREVTGFEKEVFEVSSF